MVSLSTDIIIIAIFFSVLAIIAVILRFGSRRLKPTPLGIDDWFILPGLLFAVATGVINALDAVIGHEGQHVEKDSQGNVISAPYLLTFAKLQFAAQITSVLCLAFTKFSIILFYRRIFNGKLFSLASVTLLVIEGFWGIAFFFGTLFQCFPISESWTTEPGQPGRSGINVIPFFYATAISNFLIDLMILTLPIPKIWKLQMSTKDKIAVTGIFLTGSLVLGISIARIVFFFRAGAPAQEDVTYNYAQTLYWSQLETAFAVISACLPTLRPALNFIESFTQNIFRSLASSIRSQGGETSSYTNLGADRHGSTSTHYLKPPSPVATESRGVPLKEMDATESRSVPLKDMDAYWVGKNVKNHDIAQV